MNRQKHDFVEGVVVIWNDDLGWGALASPAVEGEVWAHFSHVVMEGYSSLRPSQRVRFTYETPGQDGYPHRAISVRPL